MQSKKLMMLAIFIVGLLAIGAASAADVAGMDNTSNAIGVESNSDSILSATDDGYLEVSHDNNLKMGYRPKSHSRT